MAIGRFGRKNVGSWFGGPLFLLFWVLTSNATLPNLKSSAEELTLGMPLARATGSVVSDARGFGALLLLSGNADLQEELLLSEDDLPEIAHLASKFGATHSQLVHRALVGNSLPPQGYAKKLIELAEEADVQITNSDLAAAILDLQIEQHLSKILGHNFAAFSRAVSRNRVPFGPLALVVNHADIQAYIGMEREDIAILKTRFQKEIVSEANLYLMRLQALSAFAETLDRESEMRIKAYVGLPTQVGHPVEQPPISSICLTYSRAFRLCSPGVAEDILKADRQQAAEIELVGRRIGSLYSELKKEQLENHKVGLGFDMHSIETRCNEFSRTELQKVLTVEQQRLASIDSAKVLVSNGLALLFKQPEFQSYIGPDVVNQEFLSKGQVIDRRVEEEAETARQKVFAEFVEGLNLLQRQQLSKFVELAEGT